MMRSLLLAALVAVSQNAYAVAYDDDYDGPTILANIPGIVTGKKASALTGNHFVRLIVKRQFKEIKQQKVSSFRNPHAPSPTFELRTRVFCCQ